MKTYADLYIKRRKAISLDGVDDFDYDTYGVATDDVIAKYRKELKNLENIYEQLKMEIEKKYKQHGHYEDETTSDLIDKQLYYERKINQTIAYLDSLLEMKIIHLFKSVELNIKSINEEAYATRNTTAFHKWENIKAFFINRGIKLHEIVGYMEYQELRKLNNCIKHSSRASADVQRIIEFKEEYTIGYKKMQIFVNRIKPKVQSFVQELKNEVKKDLFVFSDARLEALVKKYYERMDKETYNTFIVKMKDRGDTYH